jgi:hypothetical protein
MDEARGTSLLVVTVRRSFTSGRLFVVYSIAISIVLGLSLNSGNGAAFLSSFPFIVSIFAANGSMGGLVVFSNDRIKGVLEYLLAYGMTPRRLFVNFLLAGMVLVTIVLALALGVGIGIYLGRGHALTDQFLLLLGVYTIPMSYASAAFVATVGMFWTSLSSPRSGMNSPVGFAPFIGIFPSLATLGAFIALALNGAYSRTTLLIVAATAVVLTAAVVIGLLATMDRFLRRERLLSPA